MKLKQKGFTFPIFNIVLLQIHLICKKGVRIHYKGEKKGFIQGGAQSIREIVFKMLKRNKDIDKIAEITDLKKSEIERLIKEEN